LGSFGQFATLIFVTYFTTPEFYLPEVFGFVVLEHLTTKQVLVCVHNTLLIIITTMVVHSRDEEDYGGEPRNKFT